MRVLFLTHSYPRFASDAAGSFLHRLAVALRAGGCDVQVLAPSGKGLVKEEAIDGVPIRRFRYAPRGMYDRVVRIDLPCSPCNRIRLPPERCVGHTPDCLAFVSVDRVLAAALSVLAESAEARARAGERPA